MKTKTLFITMLLIVISFSCGKDDDAVPTSGSDIAQPENIDDPAILPATYTEIEKLEGGFTPMLTGIVANWRVLTRIKYETLFYDDCWSGWEEEFYDAKTRDNVKGQSVTYEPCHWVYSSKTYSPDCSDPVTSVPWGQYKKGEEQSDGGQISRSIGGHSGKIARYFTIPDLPDAYVQREVKWEVVLINGGQSAEFHGVPGDVLTKETSTLTGLKETETEQWGYTLGLEFNAGVNVEFFEAGTTLKTSFEKHFSTEIEVKKEEVTSISVTGTIPNGKSAVRLQVFREVSTFTLVNEDGSPYGEGVYAPVIAVTTKTIDYAWYY